MKTAKIIVFIIFSITARHAQSMEVTNTEDAERGQFYISICNRVGQVGSIGSGWTFFATTSPRATKKIPYAMRRVSLGAFFSFYTLMQIPTMFGWDKNPAVVGGVIKKIFSDNGGQKPKKTEWRIF